MNHWVISKEIYLYNFLYFFIAGSSLEIKAIL